MLVIGLMIFIDSCTFTQRRYDVFVFNSN